MENDDDEDEGAAKGKKKQVKKDVWPQYIFKAILYVICLWFVMQVIYCFVGLFTKKDDQ